KLSNETYETEINEYKRIHLQKLSNIEIADKTLEIKIKLHEEEEKKFKKFLFTATGVILIFMMLFTFLMLSIIRDVVKKYKKQVQNRENAL
ncbi:sensor histidine kinase, partial [Aliarcobacter butzleri]